MTVGTSASDGVLAPPRRAFSSQHLLALVVLVATLGLTGMTAVISHNITRSQERTLLGQRSDELAAFLSTTALETRTSLYGAGTAAIVDGPTSTLFTTLAASLTTTGSGLIVAQQHGASFVPVAVVGSAAGRIGQPLPADVGRAIRRALSSPDMTTTLLHDAGGPRLLISLKVAAPTPTVVSLDSPVNPAQPMPIKANTPFQELDVAVYSGPVAQSANLILVSGAVPSGTTSARQFALGSDQWLVVVSARHSLVGSFALVFPWLVLGAGIALAVLLTSMIEVLARRRSYALNLVDQRTRALEEARTTAERANRAKSEFLSRMSHELRTPLNAVLGFAQLLELDDLTPEQVQNVSQIAKGGHHLLDLINEILDITQIETGHMSMSPEAVLVSDVVNDASDLVRLLAEERSVHLLGSDDHACRKYVFADRQRLKQILLNLLGNGIKYNRQGGSVSISCFEAVHGRLRIQVTDTGPGIPAEQFDKLFAPFERLGAEQTTVEGTGIGLALSRRLAEAMGGTLEVESTVGRGSTFWVEFALVEGPVERFERMGESGGAGPHVDEEARPTVLHIEDNLANVTLVERVLAQRPDVTLIPAMQGRLGLELARQHRPLLILLDLNLADMPGDEVLQQLRSDPATANIPVVMVSADAMPRQVQRLLSSGATAYLTKPIDVRALLKLVDDALAAQVPPPARPVPLPMPRVGAESTERHR